MENKSNLNRATDYAIKHGFIEDGHRKSLSKLAMQQLIATIANQRIHFAEELADMTLKYNSINHELDQVVAAYADLSTNQSIDIDEFNRSIQSVADTRKNINRFKQKNVFIRVYLAIINKPFGA